MRSRPRRFDGTLRCAALPALQPVCRPSLAAPGIPLAISLCVFLLQPSSCRRSAGLPRRWGFWRRKQRSTVPAGL